MKCELCGCSEFDACIIDGRRCHWVRPGLCSFCAVQDVMPEEFLETTTLDDFHELHSSVPDGAEFFPVEEPPLVQLATEGDLNTMIRGLL